MKNTYMNTFIFSKDHLCYFYLFDSVEIWYSEPYAEVLKCVKYNYNLPHLMFVKTSLFSLIKQNVETTSLELYYPLDYLILSRIKR